MNINLLSEQEAATLKDWIAASSRILILCHKSPDGDAIGSSLGWAEYLRSLGKNPSIIVPDAYPDFLHWLPNTDKIIRYDKHANKVEALFSQADLIFCLDFNVPTRIEEMGELLTQARCKKVMIDHHLNPSLDDAMILSYPKASSTSELVFRIVWQLDGFESMKKAWAVPVYCGMMTDTGGFTYNSTDPAIYFIISQLLSKHIDKDKIYRNVFNNYSSWAIRFRGYLLNQKMNYFEDLHASYYTVTRDEMTRFNFIKGDLEGLVNEPLRIKGTKLSISLREDTDTDNLVFVSLRSVDDFPCNKVAEEFFNGGGHLNASGGKLHCSIEEAEKIARQAIKSYAEMLRK
jgi:phosphoesterase RecJ-like protein